MKEKPIIWLQDKIKAPPFSEEAKKQAGYLIFELQIGTKLEMPISRPMPSIGRNCHELRIHDKNIFWRIIYRIDNNAILIVHIYKKKTQQTPQNIIDICKKRISEYVKDIR